MFVCLLNKVNKGVMDDEIYIQLRDLAIRNPTVPNQCQSTSFGTHWRKVSLAHLPPEAASQSHVSGVNQNGDR